MEFIELKSKLRNATGKGEARRLRREGCIPGILYGPETDPLMLTVEIADLERVLKNSRSGQFMVNLVVQNGETTTRPAMIKELQSHPVSQNYLHVDFYEIAMDRKIRVSVPVATAGKSEGIEMGGLLQMIRREIEVLCLPGQIPEAITIDISNLDIGDSCHVNDIPTPEGLEIPAEVNYTVLTILSPKVEAKAEGEEEAPEAETEEAAAEE